jgi:MoaA/NifB/PqqE/SkfB family radical SAM enzyme
MRLKNKISFVNSLLTARLFKKKTPLIVSWAITTRCNKSCAYCDIRNMKIKELETGQVLSLITELSRLGTKITHFTGGEPLLREDIGKIISHCRGRGMVTSINSNGSLIEQRIGELKDLDLLGLSLDGCEEVHDSIRGKGSYREVIAALALAKRKGISARIHTVLSKSNLHCIDFLLNKAEEFGAPILFQPSTALLLGGNKQNPLSPGEKEYKQAIGYLIAKKKKTRYIAHSIAGLRFLYHWPHLKSMRCHARLISARIESDGSVDICFRNQFKSKPGGVEGVNFSRGFYGLPYLYCDQCCCPSSVELNCILSLNPDAVFNTWNISNKLFNRGRRPT